MATRESSRREGRDGRQDSLQLKTDESGECGSLPPSLAAAPVVFRFHFNCAGAGEEGLFPEEWLQDGVKGKAAMTGNVSRIS